MVSNFAALGLVVGTLWLLGVALYVVVTFNLVMLGKRHREIRQRLDAILAALSHPTTYRNP